MEPVWFSAKLSDSIVADDGVKEETKSIVSDIMANRIQILNIVENLEGVLTNKEPEIREKGTSFFSKLLADLPVYLLKEEEVKFISKFYVDRLKDNHRIIPAVLSGYLALINMKNYKIEFCQEFFLILFREVPCQSQLRQDRYHIYLIINTLFEKDTEYIKGLGPDFIYGVISSIDGERDPRNLIYLFGFLKNFIAQVPLAHLAEEMFEVISCYYPIDFHPSPDDPAAVTRQELADALCPCLCATPDFGDLCMVLLVEKLDSALRLAKLDSLQLLATSCTTFKPETYTPFLKTLWASIQREILNKTDDELKMAAHIALAALVKNLAVTVNTDQGFESFVKGIIISMQTLIAEATTAVEFIQATKVLITTASASKESCIIVTGLMIPASIAFYDFKSSPRLQLGSLDFIGELYELAQHWKVIDIIKKEISVLPQHCLNVVSVPMKEFQFAGFKLLIRVMNEVQSDLVLPFVEILIHNVKTCTDSDLLSVSIETVQAFARKYPELIMSYVVKGKCNLEGIVNDKQAVEKRLNLLSNLASLDPFTKTIIDEMLNVVTDSDSKDSATKVVEALSVSMSDTNLFSGEKVAQIESDHNLIDNLIAWIIKDIETVSYSGLCHGYQIISNTMSSLPAEKQQAMLRRYAPSLINNCAKNEVYFFLIYALYNSLHQDLFDSTVLDVLTVSLDMSLKGQNEILRTEACALTALFLNKVAYGPKFELIYEILREYFTKCNKDDPALCSRVVILYGWFTKALIMRGSDFFMFWLQKIVAVLTIPSLASFGAEAIRLIMYDSPEYLTPRQHCRISLLYKQRLFQAFSKITETTTQNQATTEMYLLSWAYALAKTPKTVLNNEVGRITPLLIESLNSENKELLVIMLDVLSHFVQASDDTVSASLQTVLPRLINLSKCLNSMEVRMKSLQCLYDIANTYRTVRLLPFKQDILIDLGPALDDPKRLVRNMAVKARTRWFLVGSPGEAKEN